MKIPDKYSFHGMSGICLTDNLQLASVINKIDEIIDYLHSIEDGKKVVTSDDLLEDGDEERSCDNCGVENCNYAIQSECFKEHLARTLWKPKEKRNCTTCGNRNSYGICLSHGQTCTDPDYANWKPKQEEPKSIIPNGKLYCYKCGMEIKEYHFMEIDVVVKRNHERTGQYKLCQECYDELRAFLNKNKYPITSKSKPSKLDKAREYFGRLPYDLPVKIKNLAELSELYEQAITELQDKIKELEKEDVI